jgi:hypothetical protein
MLDRIVEVFCEVDDFCQAGIVTLTWIGREKTSKGRKSAFHAAFRTHVSCFQTSNALVR